MPEPDVELPHAPSGRPPFRKIEGSLSLPEAVATDVQRQAEAMDARLIIPPLPDEEEHSTHSPEEREPFPSLGGGGVPSPFIFREEEEAADNEEEAPESAGIEDESPEQPETSDRQGDTIPLDPGPGDPPGDLESGQEEESDDEVIQQPIPFQMGVTPMAEEGETTDELQTWYEGTEELRS